MGLSVHEFPLTKIQEIAIRLFEKILNNSKGIVLLHEAGLADEAYTVHRLSMEHLFNISALFQNPNFLEQLQAYSEAQIPKVLKAIKNDDDNSNELVLTLGNKVRVETALKDYEQSPVCELGYSIFNAAQKSEFPDFYNSRYRQISLSHAHSTIVSALKDNGSEETDKLLTYVNNFLQIAVELIIREFNSEMELH